MVRNPRILEPPVSTSCHGEVEATHLVSLIGSCAPFRVDWKGGKQVVGKERLGEVEESKWRKRLGKGEGEVQGNKRL